jgi:hypothetical protein
LFQTQTAQSVRIRFHHYLNKEAVMTTFDPKAASFYGQFIQAAYSMHPARWVPFGGVDPDG